MSSHEELRKAILLPKNNHNLFFSIEQEQHIALMHLIGDNSYTNFHKENCAFSIRSMVDAKVKSDEYKWKVINFDSASNSFPEGYYNKICKIKSVNLTIEISAQQWKVIILRCVGSNTFERVYIESGLNYKIVSLPVKLKNTQSRLVVEIHYIGSLNLEKAVWSTPSPTTLPQLGISITTYNKPDFLISNIKDIQKSSSYKNNLLDISVVNNGDNLDIINHDISMFSISNKGGTGGFIHAYEYFKNKKLHKFLIMDDDIVIQPDFIDRMYAISCFAGNVHVGSMAEILNTNRRIIKEQGGYVSRQNPFGLDLKHHLLDISTDIRYHIYDLFSVQFSGWWSLLVHIEKTGPCLPEQMFIKRDDIMFGYESHKRGINTYVFPNLHVAHSEEGAPAYYYFDIRNDLIMRARSNGDLKINTMKLIHVSRALCIRLFSEKQRMFNLALSDFIQGPDVLAKMDTSKKLAQVRKIAPKLLVLPHYSKHINENRRIRGYRFFTAFFFPQSYIKRKNIPVINRPTGSNVTGLNAYYEPVPFTGKAYLHKRSFVSVLLFLYSVLLIVRLKVNRSNLYKKYALRS